MICPILSTKVNVDCYEASCAWWVWNSEVCAILKIAMSIEIINNKIGGLHV